MKGSIEQRTRRAFVKTLGWASLGTALAGRTFAQTVLPAAKPLVTSFGVCTSIENYAMLKELGYSYVEDRVGNLLKPHKPDDAVVSIFERIKKEKIKVLACNSFVPGNLKSVGQNADHQGVLKHADVTFRRASQIGVKGIVFGSSGSRNIPEGFNKGKAEAQFVELLKKMAPLAQAQGVEIWIEPLNRQETNFINTQMEGAAITDQVGHPSVGIVCDLFHVARNEEPLEEVKKAARHVRHCHIAEKKNRTAPVTGGFDFKPYLAALKSNGYSRTMSMECLWKDLAAQAKPAREYVQQQINTL